MVQQGNHLRLVSIDFSVGGNEECPATAVGRDDIERAHSSASKNNQS